MQTDPAPTAPSKPWWASRTIIGAGITMVALAGGFAGIQVDAETQRVVADQLTTVVSAAAILGGTLLTIYGRVKADKTLR